MIAMRRGDQRGLDTSTQGEYTKSKPAFEKGKDFSGSKRQSQILPLRKKQSNKQPFKIEPRL